MDRCSTSAFVHGSLSGLELREVQSSQVLPITSKAPFFLGPSERSMPNQAQAGESEIGVSHQSRMDRVEEKASKQASRSQGWTD